MLNKVVKVLLIEDNPADGRLISEMFKDISKPKYELINFTTLKDGLDYLEWDYADILLIDLSLPDSSGFETFKKAHELHPRLPIVILSGLNDEELAINAVKYGAQDYLMKGDINNRLLSRALNYAIERKNSEKELIENQNELINLIKDYTEELKKRGVNKIDGAGQKLEEKIEAFHLGHDRSSKDKKENRGNIKLYNERVPKKLWLKVAEDFHTPTDKLYVSDKNIQVQSTESEDLENLVEIIKELGERGYFVEEHYVLDLDFNSNT